MVELPFSSTCAAAEQNLYRTRAEPMQQLCRTCAEAVQHGAGSGCWFCDPRACWGPREREQQSTRSVTPAQERRKHGGASSAKFQLRVRLPLCTVPCSWEVRCRDLTDEDYSSSLYYIEYAKSHGLESACCLFVLSFSCCFHLLKRNQYFFSHPGSLET